jgi:plasmid stabilization system protein ParE
LDRSERAGEAFVEEVERVAQAIAEAPKRWPIYMGGARRIPLHRFPYFIVYREDAEVILVLAVAHGRRRPGYWRPRAG